MFVHPIGCVRVFDAYAVSVGLNNKGPRCLVGEDSVAQIFYGFFAATDLRLSNRKPFYFRSLGEGSTDSLLLLLRKSVNTKSHAFSLRESVALLVEV